MKTPKYNLLLFLIIILIGLYAQTAYSQSHSERVTIVGSFKPSLAEFSKINIKPELPSTGFAPAELKFTSIEKVLSTKTEPDQIALATVQSEEKNNPYRNYVRAAIGSNISPIFQFQHYSKLSKQTSLDLGINHLSSWIKVKEYAPSDWMKNSFTAGINHAFSNYFLRTGVYYKYNTHRYYGFKPTDFPNQSFNKKDIAQLYQNIGFEGELKSNYSDGSRLHHNIGLTYNHFKDRYNAQEKSLNVSINLNKNYDWFQYDGTQTTAIEATATFNANNDSLTSTSDIGVMLLPNLSLSGSFYELKAGLRLNVMNDTAAHFFAYPFLSGKLLMFEQNVELYALLDGALNRHNHFETTVVNPFLRSGEPASWSNSHFIFETGIKTGVIKNLDLHFKINYTETENFGFFISDTSTKLKNTMKIVYGDIKCLTYVAEASYKLTNKMRVAFKAQVDQDEVSKINYAWHLPAFQTHLSVDYQIEPKLRIMAEVFYHSDQLAPTYINGIEKPITLPPFTDINIGAEYAMSEKFTLFAQINNIMHDNYQRYYNYPTQGFQLFAGMSLKF